MAANRKYQDLTYNDYSTNPATSMPVRVEAALRDGNGVRIDTNYAKKAEIPPGTVQYTYETVDFTGTTPNTFPHYVEFPYMATLSATGVTANDFAVVAYSQDQVESGHFASVAATGTDCVYLFSNTRLEGVQVPTVSVGFEFTNSSIQQNIPIRSDISMRPITRMATNDTTVAGFPYRYKFDASGVTNARIATVSFGDADAKSGDWAQICETQGGEIWIWSRVDKGATASNVSIGYVVI